MADLAQFLAYGAIGLGAILAILSFWLLNAEQKMTKPRGPMIRAIYVYMAFSLVLMAFGFVLEFTKSGRSGPTPLPPNASFDQMIDATLERFGGRGAETEQFSTTLETGAEGAFNFIVEDGRCKTYVVFAEKPSKIAVSSGDVSDAQVRTNKVEDHFVQGQACGPKGGGTLAVRLIIQMKAKGGGGRFYAAAFNAVFG